MRGFSLIEILIVIAILGILSSSAIIKAKTRLSPKPFAKQILATIEQEALLAKIEGKDRQINIAKHFVLPSGLEFSRIRFASLSNEHQTLVLRKSGSASPGIIVINNTLGENCIITQALRGARRLSCSS